MELLSNITEAQLEVIYFLNRYTKGSWIFNSKTGLVDIEGDFICCHEGLKDFKGVRFGVVTRYFYCGHNYLTSLEGAPQEVGGDFHCSYNKLTSLEGAPKKVVGGFDCSNSQLISLEGAPQEVGGDFDCSYNKLTSLEGTPQEVGGDFDCSFNDLTSLEGAPQVVTGHFSCSANELTSLKGSPQEVGGDFDCSYNKLTSLVGSPKEVQLIFHGHGFDCSNNQLTSLEGAPFSQSFYCSHNGISEKTLKLVWETMQEKKIDYWTALVILKSEISASDLEKLEGDLDKRLPKDSQKGISMMNRFRHFD
jgi:hypothetical protein